ncbi:MAG: HigA family addiction module antidote protein [Ignavibacteria bacterium]|nr:MAG: HigA family addiction module antidote protein [Ignavibacteria bacterium]
MIPKHRKPVHPGEILVEEFLKPLGMSQVELANRMHVPVQRVNTLINGRRDMTAETAILLSRVLKTTSEFAGVVGCGSRARTNDAQLLDQRWELRRPAGVASTPAFG